MSTLRSYSFGETTHAIDDVGGLVGAKTLEVSEEDVLRPTDAERVPVWAADDEGNSEVPSVATVVDVLVLNPGAEIVLDCARDSEAGPEVLSAASAARVTVLDPKSDSRKDEFVNPTVRLPQVDGKVGWALSRAQEPVSIRFVIVIWEIVAGRHTNA